MSQPPASSFPDPEPWDRPADAADAVDPYATNPYATNPYEASPSDPSDYGYGETERDPFASSASDAEPSSDGSTGDDSATGAYAADPYAQPADAPPADASPYAAPQAYAPQQQPYVGQQPYAPQQPYAAQPAYGYAPAPPSSGVALASMITGIAALALGSMCGLPILAAPVAIILGAMGMRETGPGQKAGCGFAITGLATGILGTVVFLGIVLLYGGMILAVILGESTAGA